MAATPINLLWCFVGCALGIPTSNTTAILLGRVQNHGIQPGPQLFTNSSALVWALIASLHIGNVMLLVLNLPMVGHRSWSDLSRYKISMKYGSSAGGICARSY